MDRFPNELLLLIIKYLDRKSIGELCAVSKSFYSRFHELAGFKYNPSTYRIMIEYNWINWNRTNHNYFYVKHNESIMRCLVLHNLRDDKKSFYSLRDDTIKIINANSEYYKIYTPVGSILMRKSVIFNSDNVIIDYLGFKKNPRTCITFQTFINWKYIRKFRNKLKCSVRWNRGNMLILSGTHSLTIILNCLYNDVFPDH